MPTGSKNLKLCHVWNAAAVLMYVLLNVLSDLTIKLGKAILKEAESK